MRLFFRAFLPVVFIIHLCLFFSCSNSSPTAPCIAFNDTICHLSLTKDNPRDSFDFVYRNTGDQKLVIFSVAPSCHCVRATFEQKLLAKGDSSFIRIYFDGSNEPEGFFWRTLDVYTNAQDEPITLDIDGTIE